MFYKSFIILFFISYCGVFENIAAKIASDPRAESYYLQKYFIIKCNSLHDLLRRSFREYQKTNAQIDLTHRDARITVDRTNSVLGEDQGLVDLG